MSSCKFAASGNLTRFYDAHTGLNIRYNHLNLVEKVMRGDTIVAKYSYLSDGTKLSATDSVGNGLYYSGSLVYGKQDGALRLESCGFSGGRFVATVGGIEPHYFITDHLGSVRAVVNSSGAVLERNDYYPFGKRWDDGLLSDNRYRYNGKENQSFLNNPYTDYGARQYDPDAGIWHGVDPLAEITSSISTYAFCLNNPVLNIDPTGMSAQASGADSTQVINIDPVVVSAPGSNSSANLMTFIMWSASGWGKMWNDATGNRDASFNDNMFTGFQIWQSVALSWGMAKMFKGSGVKNDKKRINWTFGKHKTTQKWFSQMKVRGWNMEQISEAIQSGKKYKAVNLVNKSNTATRYVHPQTGKSVVIDDVTHEILHIGGADFKY